MKNFYQILSVDEYASLAEIKGAYRKLSKKIHPDLNQDNQQSEELFKEVKEAYEVLSNQQRRADYDQKLKDYKFQAKFKKANSWPGEDDTAYGVSRVSVEQQGVNISHLLTPERGIGAFLSEHLKSIFIAGGAVIIIIVALFLTHKNSATVDMTATNLDKEAVNASRINAELQKSIERRKKFWQQCDGVWTGSGMEINLKHNFSIKLSCDFENHNFSIYYPSFGFSGHWKVQDMQDNKIDFEETLDSGLIYKTQVGRVELTFVNNNTLSYKYYFPDDQNLMAEGTLKRS